MAGQKKAKKGTVQADHRSIAVGSVHIEGDLSGTLHIGNTTGFTADEVSILLTQIASTLQPKPFDGRCPYKGLDVFEEEDAELFFGREKLVDDLVSRVKDSRAVFVTGPSGSGKSSLVRAGLIPALKQGAIKGSDRWLYATMKPGRDPIGELGRVISSLASSTNPEDEIRNKAMKDATIFARWCEIVLKEGRDKRLVLFIDQFEEVFTQISKEEERLAFLNLLTYAATVENGRMIILFSMRSDFVSNCATYPQLNALLNQQFVQIGAMQPEELVSAIAQPALRVGLRIDPDLIAQIINEMKGEPGALPLMQFALKDLFDSQQEKSGVPDLTLTDYLQRGGIHKSLERHANDAFSKLSKDEQELARSIFSGLIEIGRGAEDTKRTALFDELVPTNTKAEDVKVIVQKLADARLVTTEEGSNKYTITHEKLMDAWPWLKKLINENRDAITLQNEIASAAKEWEGNRRDASYLYSGTRLVNIREQLITKKLVLSSNSNEFILIGFKKARQAQAFRVISVAVIVATVLIAVVVFSFQSALNSQKLADQSFSFANTQRAIASTAQANADEAQKQAKIAQANELASLALSTRETDFNLSMLLSVKAFSTADTPRAREELINSVLVNSRLKQNFFIDTQFNNYFISAHNDSYIAIASGASQQEISIMSVNSGIKSQQVPTNFPVLQMAISTTNILAYATTNSIDLWDLEKNVPAGTIPVENADIILFSPNGSTLITTQGNRITIWEVGTLSRVVGTFNSALSSISSIAISSSGDTLAWSGCIRDSDYKCGNNYIFIESLFDSNKNRVGKIESPDAIADLEFTNDGQSLVSTNLSGNMVSFWDLKTKNLVDYFSINENDSFNYTTKISPGGNFLAASFCAKKHIFFIICEQEGIKLWDLNSRTPIGENLIGSSQFFTPLGFSNDNSLMFTESESSVTIWERSSPPPTIQSKNIAADLFVVGVSYLSNGTPAKLVVENNSLLIKDIETNKTITTLLDKYNGIPYSISLNEDNNIIATSGNDGEAVVWNKGTEKPIMTLKNIAANSPVVLNKDGRYLMSTDQNGNLNLWATQTSELVATYPNNIQIMSAAFSPDGKTLAIFSSIQGLALLDIPTSQKIGNLPGNSSYLNSITFSSDGKTLFTGNNDGSITLYDVATLRQYGTLPASGEEILKYMSVSPNGKELIALGLHNINIWNIDPEFWLRSICQLSGRNFSFQEVQQYLGNNASGVVCPNWSTHPTFITQKILPILSDGTNKDRVQEAIDQAKNMFPSKFDESEKTEQAQSIVTENIKMQISLQYSTVGYTNFHNALIWAENAEKIKIKDKYLADNLNILCWNASLSNQATKAIMICNVAIGMFPGNYAYIDSRGLARALTGDFAGAILDFQYYIDHSDDSASIEQRYQWIEQLKKGINPFTPEVLESLKSQ